MPNAKLPDSVVTTAGRDDHRPFAGESHIDPLQRLARFVPLSAVATEAGYRIPAEEENSYGAGDYSGDYSGDFEEDGEGEVERGVNADTGVDVEGDADTDVDDDGVDVAANVVLPEQFHHLKKGELEDAPRVYVFVHGWLPGSRETADSLFAQQGAVTAWDERVSNRAGRTMISSYSPLLSALAERDPEAAVLWFSWVDQSSTDTEVFAARDSFRNTEVNGRRLAIALQEAFGDAQPKLHILGHSHGCVVATHASLALKYPPRQLTLLDCPEDWFSRAGGAAGLLDNVLPRLQPDRGDTPTFVDSFSSMFGRSYHGEPGLAGVVDVRLAPRLSTKKAATVGSQAHQFAVDWYAESVADEDRDEGFGWSPMHGFDTSELAAAYVHAVRGPLIPLASYKPDVESSVNTYQVEQLTAPAQSLSRGESDLALTIRTDPFATFVEFDYEIRRAGRKTTLEVAIDRQLKFVADADVKVPGRGRYVRLDPSSGDSTLLQFRIRDPGRFTVVTVQRIRILRGESRSKNYDDRSAAVAIALLGAVAGSVATLAIVGAGMALRRVLTNSGSRAHEL